MNKIILIILIIFLATRLCYGDSIVLKEGKTIKGTILYQNDTCYYIYTKEGLKEVSPKDIEY